MVSPSKLKRVDAKTQKRLDYLMTRSNEGELTGAERAEFETMTEELEALSVTNAKLLAKRVPPGPASNAQGGEIGKT